MYLVFCFALVLWISNWHLFKNNVLSITKGSIKYKPLLAPYHCEIHIRIWITSSHFAICEAASKTSSNLQSSLYFQKRKLQSVIYSSYNKYYNIKTMFINLCHSLNCCMKMFNHREHKTNSEHNPSKSCAYNCNTICHIYFHLILFFI